MSVLAPIVTAMSQVVVLPVPPTVSSQFVVLAPANIPSSVQPLLRRWARRVRWPCAATTDLTSPNLTIMEINTAALGDLDTLLRTGCSPAVVRRVRSADAHLLVMCDSAPTQLICPAMTSYGIANELALATGGLIFDPLTCEVTNPDREMAGMEVDLTGPPAIPVSGWVRLWEDDGRVRTRGMARFGLPDLSTKRLPSDLARDWICVLSATGSLLIRQVWEMVSSSPPGTFLEVANPLMLCDHLVHAEAGAYDLLADVDRPHRATPVGLRLDFDPADDSTIELTRPDGFVGSHQKWLRQTASHLLGGA